MDPVINYCSHCGAGVSLQVPPGDSLARHVCARCGTIHYQNPKLVVGSLPVWQDKILLCRRAIEPRHGKWTLPAGFMENHETLPQAALRETIEEACAQVELGEMYTLISVPHISQVHVIYRARLLDLDFAPGIETLELRPGQLVPVARGQGHDSEDSQVAGSSVSKRRTPRGRAQGS